MYGILLASAVPATPAAGFNSPGLALLAAAGAIWAAAVFASSTAPLISGTPSSLNERVATALSVAAATAAMAGTVVVAADLLV
ncbi:MAG: hypothetical protein OER12_05320 [Acidimicrobiia bacterium]|nr:hypothetical protein [Acidimicrobiia bacterium]